MKKVIRVLLVIVLLSIVFTSTAFASNGNPAGSCPPSFELHHYMEHSGDHTHVHIGLDRDLNGDGYICMKTLPFDMHLHVDNSIPLN